MGELDCGGWVNEWMVCGGFVDWWVGEDMGEKHLFNTPPSKALEMLMGSCCCCCCWWFCSNLPVTFMVEKKN